MTLGIVAASRNAFLDDIKTRLDAGALGGKLRFYSGTRPATGAALSGNTLLAELTFGDPSAPAAANGVLTFNSITQDSSADNTGVATWARAVDSDGNFVFDASVGVSGADINLSSTSIQQSGPVSVTSASITAGNP